MMNPEPVPFISLSLLPLFGSPKYLLKESGKSSKKGSLKLLGLKDLLLEEIVFLLLILTTAGEDSLAKSEKLGSSLPKTFELNKTKKKNPKENQQENQKTNPPTKGEKRKTKIKYFFKGNTKNKKNKDKPTKTIKNKKI